MNEIQLNHKHIYLSQNPTDFRKQIDGLIQIVLEEMELSPTEGIYIFINRAKNKAKVILWHLNGFVMVYKRLNKGIFTIHDDGSGQVKLSSDQLQWFLAGVDWIVLSGLSKPDLQLLQ